MLYLAEVKKQTRGFIGGYKTELKLLACQHKDQTWSSIAGEDIFTYDETNSLGEGALLLVNLGNNRQLQGNPELAGAEMVRQLQKISRLMERSKKDQEKIEQWKQSLTYQSEILNRQKMEMEARIEQIELSKTSNLLENNLFFMFLTVFPPFYAKRANRSRCYSLSLSF